MRVKRPYDYMIGQLRRICKGQAASSSGGCPTRGEGTGCKIDVYPTALLMSLAWIAYLGIGPRFPERLKDNRVL